MSDEPLSADRELVARLRRGDTRAFGEVYSAYRARIYAFLLRLSGRRDVAEDLLQETWIKLARSAPNLREDTTIAAWLFTVARNQFVSYRRWALLDVTRVLAFGVEEVSSVPSPETNAEAGRAIAVLERALSELSTAQREVLLLVGVEGLEQEEVAKILGVTYDTLRQRLSRAREKLGERIDAIEKRTFSQAACASARRGVP